MKSTDGLGQKNTVRICAVFLSLLVLLHAAVLCSICIGSVGISFSDVFRILFSGAQADGVAAAILWKIRLPRVMLAFLLGGALALSGFLMQTFFRNPIAGPFVLGVSSGAKLFLTLTTVVWTGLFHHMPVSATVFAAFVGSLLSMLPVLLLGGRVRSMSSLLVIGIMVGYVCSAVTDFLIHFASDAQIVDLVHWSQGSFSAAGWSDVRISAWIILPALLAVFLLSKPMGAYLLGEGYAQTLGVNTRVFRLLLVLFTGILSSAVAAFAGPISFVGVAVPHIARRLFKTEKPILMIPASFLCGALFCVVCDLAARTLFAPTELTLSTVTSAIGAPIVIRLMLARKERRGGRED